MDLLIQLGERVKSLRREKGLSRVELARRARISPRFLAEVEAGKGNIAITRLVDLCDALETPLAFLAAGLRREGATADGRGSQYESILSTISRCGPEELVELQLRLSGLAGAQPDVVALIGLRGAGKTTIGRKVAARLQRPFVELDELIERRAGMGLQTIFEVHGEEYYRRLEGEALREFLSRRGRSVLAVPGGVVTRSDSFDLVLRHCTTVWLKARPEDHWNRVLRQDPRPMAHYPNAFEHLQSLLRAREPLYSRAIHTVDTSAATVGESVDRIVQLVEEKIVPGDL
jgi:XRE family aerobic/anaerobic benzoate catabolism transcriptional regulator